LHSSKFWALLALAMVALLGCELSWCEPAVPPAAERGDAPTPGPANESPLPGMRSDDSTPSDSPDLASDIKAYFTAPLRWNGGDWAWFGGSLLAIGAAHHYDTQVRTHFVRNLAPGQRIGSNDLPDAIPTAAVIAATWGYAALIDANNGRREAWTMLEAAGLSSVTAYALKYAIGRDGPDDTSDPNAWRKGGSNSFPSWHSTAAFAVGTVLAESGNDEYRWVRRLLGYGLGAATSYERLKHNAHWLSDTVAGAALGIASARFTMNRQERGEPVSAGLALEPVAGGAMLTYRLTLR
jgi:membrane-associated phospholipid phosphatase